MGRKTYGELYFTKRILPYIKKLLEILPKAERRLDHHWSELREFHYKKNYHFAKTDLPARIILRLSGMREEFSRGVPKWRLTEIQDEISDIFETAISHFPEHKIEISRCLDSYVINRGFKHSINPVEKTHQHRNSWVDGSAQSSSDNKSNCFNCNEPLSHLPFKCRRCSNLFCDSCRIPENHNCSKKSKKSDSTHRKVWNEWWEPENRIASSFRGETTRQTHGTGIHIPFFNRKFDLVIFTILLFCLVGGIILIKFPTLHDRINFENSLNQLIGCKDGTSFGSCSPTRYLCGWGGLSKSPLKCGCPTGERLFGPNCVHESVCSDGTKEPECSIKFSKQCINGKLVFNPRECGCPNGYSPKGANCVQTCSDGTEYGSCANEQPKFCKSGFLVSNPQLCGCPYGLVLEKEKCVSEYSTSPKVNSYKFKAKGKEWNLDFTVYGGLKDYLSNLDRSIRIYSGEPEPTDLDFALKNLNEREESAHLDKIVSAFKDLNYSNDDTVRLIVAFVQGIPYDFESFESNDLKARYPYEVIYDNTGVCGEKAPLLAYMLRKLGYGVVLFQFNRENHMAVGIKCPNQFSFQNTGYCFIEATEPNIITYSYGEYVGAGKLTSSPDLLKISDGMSFNSVPLEYHDALLLKELTENGRFLSAEQYDVWQRLVRKYGLITNPRPTAKRKIQTR